jgi:hypothetical protein
MMSLSMLFMASVFVGQTKSEKAIRWIFIGDFVLTAVSFGLFTVFYGIFREYRFEVAAFSINWLALVASGILLSVIFRKAMTEVPRKQNTKLSTQSAGV